MSIQHGVTDYQAPPSPNPSEATAAPTASVSSTSGPPATLPKTGGNEWLILTIGLAVLAIGMAISLTMRKLRRNN